MPQKNPQITQISQIKNLQRVLPVAGICEFMRYLKNPQNWQNSQINNLQRVLPVAGICEICVICGSVLSHGHFTSPAGLILS
jgi:hypothetical protein